jgi:hypothetical protein
VAATRAKRNDTWTAITLSLLAVVFEVGISVALNLMESERHVFPDTSPPDDHTWATVVAIAGTIAAPVIGIIVGLRVHAGSGPCSRSCS